mmetsp:Transcript_79274/g.230206  ORF Transcript_79274/g.230206 Transcript_79274/m.230206 type:complete len:328 (+) Transcript_79274:1361-2344(+)
MSFKRASGESPSKQKFSNFKSRWHTLCRWQYATADTICRTQLAASASLYRPFRARWSNKSGPRIRSKTSLNCPGSSNTSRRRHMFGCDNTSWFSTSRRACTNWSLSRFAVDKVLTATLSPEALQTALLTTPESPLPSTDSWSSYFVSKAPGSWHTRPNRMLASTCSASRTRSPASGDRLRDRWRPPRATGKLGIVGGAASPADNSDEPEAMVEAADVPVEGAASRRFRWQLSECPAIIVAARSPKMWRTAPTAARRFGPSASHLTSASSGPRVSASTYLNSTSSPGAISICPTQCGYASASNMRPRLNCQPPNGPEPNTSTRWPSCV